MKRKFGFAKCAALVLVAALLLLSASVPVLAAVPSRPENGYVLDKAEVLSEATEKRIVSENERLFRETGAEIVVVTVDFLGGKEIDDYVHELFNAWGVGSAERNNGVLLVLAVGEDNYFAQSGYGIEDHFDGALLDELLYEYLEPDFAAGKYDAGVKKVFDAFLSEMRAYYSTGSGASQSSAGSETIPLPEEPDWNAGVSTGQPGSSSTAEIVLGVLAVLVIVGLIVWLIVRVVRSSGGGSGPGTGGGRRNNFWTGMLVGRMMSGARRSYSRPVSRGYRPPRTGGGFSRGGGSRSIGAGRSGGFSRGGGSRGGGAGRR